MSDDFDFDGIIIVLVGIVVAGLMIFGVLGLINKAFKPAMKKPQVNSSEVLRDQSRRMDKIQRDQEQMMRNLKQKIRDSKR